jgi:hypothetical protein
LEFVHGNEVEVIDSVISRPHEEHCKFRVHGFAREEEGSGRQWQDEATETTIELVAHITGA